MGLDIYKLILFEIIYLSSLSQIPTACSSSQHSSSWCFILEATVESNMPLSWDTIIVFCCKQINWNYDRIAAVINYATF